MSFIKSDQEELLSYLHTVHEEGPLEPDDVGEINQLYKLRLTPSELGYITGMLAAHIDIGNGIIK